MFLAGIYYAFINRFNKKQNRVFAILLFTVILHNLNVLLYEFSLISNFIQIAEVFTPYMFLIPPVYYFFIISCIESCNIGTISLFQYAPVG